MKSFFFSGRYLRCPHPRPHRRQEHEPLAAAEGHQAAGAAAGNQGSEAVISSCRYFSCIPDFLVRIAYFSTRSYRVRTCCHQLIYLFIALVTGIQLEMSCFHVLFSKMFR